MTGQVTTVNACATIIFWSVGLLSGAVSFYARSQTPPMRPDGK